MITTNGPIDYVLFSDTNCGVNGVNSKRYDINLISIPISVNGKDYYPYKSSRFFEYSEFFDNLRKTSKVYTWKSTAEDYKKRFRPFFEKGLDIIFVHFSHFGTNTFEYDLPQALGELKKEFPDRRISVVDSLSVAQGSLPIVLMAGKMRLAGGSFEEVEGYLKNNAGTRVAYFIPQDLSYLYKYGKVGGLASFVGNAFGIKPILMVNTKGEMSVVSKFMGQDMALSKKILTKMAKDGLPIDGKIDIGYTDSKERGELFKSSFESMSKKMKTGPFKYDISRINPHHSGIIGPGAVGLAYTIKPPKDE